MSINAPLIAATLLLIGVSPALAFDPCDKLSSDPAELSREITDLVKNRTPVKYSSVLDSIRFVPVDSSDRLIPFAGLQQGTKIVVTTPLFKKVVCAIALTEFLIIDDSDTGDYKLAIGTAAKCLDSGRPQKVCLVGFAMQLGQKYAKTFAGLPSQNKEAALFLFNSTFEQIVMHEYAHHFLDHFHRVKAQKLSRLDAEFEADFFAIMNGVQEGGAASAMHYFFQPIADIEANTNKTATKEYESGTCRAGNVEGITAIVKLAPITLLDASYGGGFKLRHNSPSVVRSIAKDQFSGPPPAFTPLPSCKHLDKNELRVAFEELKQLYLRFASDSEVLFENDDKKADSQRVSKLLQDISEMSRRQKYMNVFAAKCISLILRNWGLKGRALAPVIGYIDRLLDNEEIIGNFLSGDYGRLLQAQGLAILQERTDLKREPRLDRAFFLLQRAVLYNPAQSEAWMNLAFIAFMRGDCAAAANFGDRSLKTFEDGGGRVNRQQIQALVQLWKKWSRDPKTCTVEGASSHVYPGL